MPALADRFEIIAVDDGSRDADAGHRRPARGGPPRCRPGRPPPDEPRLRRGPPIRLPGGPLRPRLLHRRRPPVPGGRPRPPARPAREADAPDVVVGYRIRRADPPIRTLYARLYKLANRVWFGLRVRDVDCACKLFRRSALEGVRVESGGAFFSAELLVKLRASGRSIVEVGVPHYPRTAGSPTGAKPSVIWRAVKDFWGLRLRMWANRARALRRGEPIVVDAPGA